MTIFLFGIVVGVAICCAMELLINIFYSKHIASWGRERINDWDKKKARYGIDYSNTKKD